MPKTRTPFTVTQLEARDVPTAVALGDGWNDARNLTISFAPDGTLIGQPPPSAVEVHTLTTSLFGTLGLSGLNSILTPLTTTTDGLTGSLTSGPNARSNASAEFRDLNNWQREILRAFQTWVAATNVNIGLSGDMGAAFGSGGAYQGDGRYGDIRIGGTRLSSAALANAMIVSPENGTWSGDVLFNTAVNYRTGLTPANSWAGYDLFTVALHVFGLEHSDDPYSVMSESYRGVRTGLSASDLATVRSYYGGARLGDGFEALGANDSRGTAFAVNAARNFTLVGDLTTADDADWYSFRLPAGTRSFAVNLTTAGLSLLTTQLTVVDATGRVVGTAEATDPTRGNLRINVSAATTGPYYLRVASPATDVFGIGRYRLSVGGLGGETVEVTPAGPYTASPTVAPPPADAPVLSSGTLTSSTTRSQFNLTLAQSGLLNLETEADSNASGVDVITEVFDANGRKVMSFTQTANGSTASKSAYLAAGRYTIRTTAVIPLFSRGVSVDFTVRGTVESDPMGTYRPGTTANPYPHSSGGSTGGSTGGGGSTGSTGTTTNSTTGSRPYSY